MRSDEVFVLPAATLPRRRRRRVLVGVVVAALVGGATALAVGLTGAGTGSGPGAAGPAATGRTDPATQVVHDGDRVEGTGAVVAVTGQPVRFCAPVPVADVGGREEEQAKECSDGLVVTGVDLDAVAGLRTFPSVRTGVVHLVGTWHEGELTDVVQSAPAPSVVPETATPCAAPAGGWPTGPADENIDLAAASAYQQAHPSDIVTIAMLRPSKTQVLAYVVTSGDPAPVEAALAPAIGPRLCVVRSRYTPAELSAAEAAVQPTSAVWTAGHAYTSDGAGNIGADGQPEFAVGLPWVTDDVLAAVHDLAPGLVQFEPWLTPVS